MHLTYLLIGKGMAERYMDHAGGQRPEKKQPTISGSGTSSWVPEGATTARRVSPLKALQMSSWVTYLYVQRLLRKFTPQWEKIPEKLDQISQTQVTSNYMLQA